MCTVFTSMSAQEEETSSTEDESQLGTDDEPTHLFINKLHHLWYFLGDALELLTTNWQEFIMATAFIFGIVFFARMIWGWIFKEKNQTESHAEPTNQGPTLKKTPFRTMPPLDKETYEEMKEKVTEFSIPNVLRDQPTIRVLVLGPMGCGKSSFYATVYAALKGDWVPRADIGRDGTSLTRELREYDVKLDAERYKIPFIFCDSAGLGEEETLGLDTISQIMDGYIKKGQSLAPGARRDMEMSEAKRRVRQIHVVVFGADCTKVESLSAVMKSQFQNVRKLANEKKIPMLGLLTKVDKMLQTDDNEVNLSNLYYCEEFQRAVDVFSKAVNLPKIQIHGIMNYHDDPQTNTKMNALTMIVLKHITKCATAYLENKEFDQEEQDAEEDS